MSSDRGDEGREDMGERRESTLSHFIPGRESLGIYASMILQIDMYVIVYVCIYISLSLTLISPVISLKLPGGVCTPCFLQTGQSQKVAFGCLWHLGFQGPGQNQNKLSKLHPLLAFCSANPSNQQTPPGIAQESNASAQ